MKWNLATDEQLQNIIKFDFDCPRSLLSEVVGEMLKRNLFDGLIVKMINRRFKSLSIACDKLATDRDELIQEGNIEIWKCLSKYQPGRSSFANYCSLRLISLFRDMEKAIEADKRGVLLSSCSLYTPLYEDVTLAEVFACGKNVESMVIKKISLEEKFSILKENERRTIHLYSQGYCLDEIADIEHISKSGVSRRIKKIIKKLSGREVNLKELGIFNYRKGA